VTDDVIRFSWRRLHINKRYKKFDKHLQERVKTAAQKLSVDPYRFEELKGPLKVLRLGCTPESYLTGKAISIIGCEGVSEEMIAEYIQAALMKARYELIADEEPYYGEVPELAGVWATGKTLEECRKNLAEVIDGWLVVRLRKGIAHSTID